MNFLKIVIVCLFLFQCTLLLDLVLGRHTFDPRTIGMQIDDTIMQKNLVARLSLVDKKYFFIQVEVLDGRIFLSGKVDAPQEKSKLLKWPETKGVDQ